ncbi:Fur family transcriptional regulator [Isobaculum melis]|uniref:Zinc uptake regulator, Fur family n=1 Tax=Isobaculum melis TaxID=142588 RepID=A0A1H9RSE4_9LACT|nr:Fur family transcriptional regulator [Isobaculum melis]SER75577.1 zinc uptake regulator, Fur family [Isobaculum melis]
MTGASVEKAIQLLKEKGYKYTDKRQSMIELFAQADRYLTAKEVQKYLKQTYPSLSYDTIYRNLYSFVEMNILEETELSGEKMFRFSCSLDGQHHHHHFICTKCGMTKNIHMCPMDFFKEQLDGCEIQSHRFEIFGTCENCLKVS